MTERATDALTGVSETLLIPLAARMMAPTCHPDLQFRDDEAIRIGAALGFDPARFAGDTGSMRGSVLRALWFDRITRTFLDHHPSGLCVSIGSGLDDRPARIGLPATAGWIDVDFAAVVHLRQTLIARRDNVRTLTVSEAEPMGWLHAIGWKMGRPVLVLAEGVLMYLAPAEGEGLLRGLVERAAAEGAPLDLAADFASPLMVRQSRRNPSIAKTRARFQWAVARPEDVRRIAPGLSLIEAADVARRAGKLSWLATTLHRALTGRPIYFCGHYRYGPADFA